MLIIVNPDRAAAETGAALLRDHGLAAEVTPEGLLRALARDIAAGLHLTSPEP